jgi:hypothetical protein
MPWGLTDHGVQGGVDQPTDCGDPCPLQPGPGISTTRIAERTRRAQTHARSHARTGEVALEGSVPLRCRKPAQRQGIRDDDTTVYSHDVTKLRRPARAP